MCNWSQLWVGPEQLCHAVQYVALACQGGSNAPVCGQRSLHGRIVDILCATLCPSWRAIQTPLTWRLHYYHTSSSNSSVSWIKFDNTMSQGKLFQLCARLILRLWTPLCWPRPTLRRGICLYVWPFAGSIWVCQTSWGCSLALAQAEACCAWLPWGLILCLLHAYQAVSICSVRPMTALAGGCPEVSDLGHANFDL